MSSPPASFHPQYLSSRKQKGHTKHIDKDSRIGTWNVFILHRPGSLNIVINEADRYGSDVLAIQEPR